MTDFARYDIVSFRAATETCEAEFLGYQGLLDTEPVCVIRLARTGATIETPVAGLTLVKRHEALDDAAEIEEFFRGTQD
jgi:hypothetical protein